MYSFCRTAVFSIYIVLICIFCISINKGYAQSAELEDAIEWFGLTCKSTADNSVIDSTVITWTEPEAGSGWKIADQYIEIEPLKDQLPPLWGLQFFTDNKNSVPAYTGVEDPAGLVNLSHTHLSLPMAWRITDTILSSSATDPQMRPTDPVERSDNKGFTNYMWRFVKDKNTPDKRNTPEDEAFYNAQDYVVLWNQLGIGWNEGGAHNNPNKAYLYLAARFSTATVGTEYKTTKLKMEEYKDVSPFPIYIYKDAPKTAFPDDVNATLENHFAPSGWVIPAADPDNPDSPSNIMTVKENRAVNPHLAGHDIGDHCIQITVRRVWPWSNTLKWQEPKNEWDGGAGKGYDLRGITKLTFWAMIDCPPVSAGATDYVGVQFSVGNGGDSCGSTNYPDVGGAEGNGFVGLDNQWQKFTIDLSQADLSHVSEGLSLSWSVFNFPSQHIVNWQDWNIYLDDIKFEE